jgi:Tfp pilus assembly protein PilX
MLNVTSSRNKNGTGLERTSHAGRSGEEGLAVLIAIVALSIFSLLGMYMSVNASTEVRISDNYESKVQAEIAARAGLSHAREIMRDFKHNDLLKGPDGTYNNSTTYLAQAATYGYRNWLSWATARSLDITDPTSAVSGIPDDGLINTGKYNTTNGTVIVPATGIALTSPNPYGSGNVITARYFLKVSDNNGEASETLADPTNNPFIDGDGIVIVRSMGVAKTVREAAGGVVRANSTAVYEMRYKRSSTFDFHSPIVLQGNTIVPSAPSMFNGNAFEINGGATQYGISTIDPDLNSGTPPAQQVSLQLAGNQRNNVTGLGGAASIGDITSTLTGDGLDLLNAGYLYSFTKYDVPSFAYNKYTGNQSWGGGSGPYMGYYDSTKPMSDPVQDPKVTWVDGDLSFSGGATGAGLLVITGKLSGNGALHWDGIVLVIGKGDADFSGMNVEINGGIYVVNDELDANGVAQFGTTKFTVSGNSDLIVNDDASKLAVSRIPPRQLSYREITSAMDPN